ncbi:MAG TPA: VOC family protein [Candidatus Pelethosoma merdigallinarum]|nr:VOC family protein [Candidatus Pelethosoma merdigallinarum]
MKFNSLIPELSVSNIQNSMKFYTDLGFHIVYERKNDKFAFLELEENQLMIEEINEHWNTGPLEYPFGRGINLSMTVSDVKKMAKRIKKKGYPLFLDVETHSYMVDGTLCEDQEFLIQDPDGYLLRFNN